MPRETLPVQAGNWESVNEYLSLHDALTVNVADKRFAGGAKVDTKKIAGGITTGTKAYTATTSAFAATDVGKTIHIAGAGAAGVPLTTTIATYTSATQVALTASASTTVSNAITYFGTDDTAAWRQALAAIPALGGRIFCPAGMTWVPNGGLSCSNMVVLVGAVGTYDVNGGTTMLITADSVTALTLTGPASGLERMCIMHPSDVGTRSSGLIGVVMTNSNFNRVDKAQIQGFSTNLKMDTGVYATISDCSFRDFVLIGLDVRYTGQQDAGDIRIEGNTFDRTGSDTSTGGQAIFCTTMGGLFVSDNKVNGRSGVNAFDDAVHIQLQDGMLSSAFMITDNSLESARTGVLIDRLNVSGNISNSVVIVGNEINGLNNAGATGININGPGAPGVVITGNNIVLDNVCVDIGNVSHASIEGNSFYSIITTGIRVRTLSKDVRIGNSNTIDMVSGGKSIVLDDPYYVSDPAWETSIPFRDIADASNHDLFEIATSGSRQVIVDIDLTGVNQGSGGYARRFSRVLQGGGGGDATLATIGTDYTGTGTITVTFTTAALAGAMRFGVTKAVGTTLDGHCRVKVRGNGLSYFKPLLRDN